MRTPKLRSVTVVAGFMGLSMLVAGTASAMITGQVDAPVATAVVLQQEDPASQTAPVPAEVTPSTPVEVGTDAIECDENGMCASLIKVEANAPHPPLASASDPTDHAPEQASDSAADSAPTSPDSADATADTDTSDPDDPAEPDRDTTKRDTPDRDTTDRGPAADPDDVYRPDFGDWNPEWWADDWEFDLPDGWDDNWHHDWHHDWRDNWGHDSTPEERRDSDRRHGWGKRGH